jgi:hypothetical protein
LALVKPPLAKAHHAGRDVRLCAPVEGDANRFCRRFGLVETHRDAFDVDYLRRAAPAGEPCTAPAVPRA